MKYLVDANVLSEPSRPHPNRAAAAWLTHNVAAIVVNPIVLGEIQYGILKLPAGRRRTRLLEWFADSAQLLPVVPIDAGTATEWSKLLIELQRKGRTMPVKDSLIAATARQHDLIVATRNVSDYRYSGVAVANPFKD